MEYLLFFSFILLFFLLSFGVVLKENVPRGTKKGGEMAKKKTIAQLKTDIERLRLEVEAEELKQKKEKVKKGKR